MSNKLFGIISLSRKAGKLVNGFDAVKDAINSGQAKLIIYASDVSDRTKRSMDWVLENSFNKIPAKDTDLPMFEYGRICGKITGVLALTDKGFADAAAKLIEADEAVGLMSDGAREE